ncbi:cell division protein SepF [Planosporangium thailandense]|uniref:Cell division protein SepF n=1 Tax=Planosporangium thailandense TaxID=765197 RepID=A0ABX0Y200_9ACTN|nr:cell division protein SepF [Planosporangium thailandense]NJC72376.1 cell division protein SepF [Planosporangium thailandense]
MGSLRRTGAWLGLAEDDDDLDADVEDDYADGRYSADSHYSDDPGRPAGQRYRRRPALDRRTARDPRDARTPRSAPERDSAGDAEADSFQIATIHARGFRDARTIGEYYRQDIPVVIDLSGLEDPDARRIVDFAAGLIFGRRGGIHRLARGVFLLSPLGTGILSGDRAPSTSGDFFDQS